MKTARTQTTDRPRSEPVRRTTAGSWFIELLPRQAYDATYVPDRAVIGFAFETQRGTHAFSSDRVQPFQTKPNGLAFIPSQCDVFSSSLEGGEYLRVVDVNELDVDGLTQRPFNDWIDPAAIAVAQSIRSLLLVNAATPLLIEERAIALSEHVRSALQGDLIKDTGGGSMTVARLKLIEEYIDANLDGEITVRALAASVGLSEGFFIRAFRAAVGQSPHRYLIDRRLARARLLLRTSRHDLREIAFATGFSSHAHMTAAFRERLGISPSHFRSEVSWVSDAIRHSDDA
jgi:AraC family transcriptional regulator